MYVLLNYILIIFSLVVQLLEINKETTFNSLKVLPI